MPPATTEISAAIDIAATPERVWAVLTDLASYPQWNPVFREASGQVAVGNRITLTSTQPATGHTMTVKVKVLTAEPATELRWVSSVLGLMTSKRSFTLSPANGGTRLMQGDSVLLCEEHGNDPQHTVSRYILEQTPLKLIVYDPRSNRLETVTDLSILDRIKVSTHVGYNVFGTASAFWLDRINALNAKAGRRAQ